MQNNRTNYYEILGVPNNATKDDIRKAWRKLSLKHHPDKNGGVPSELCKKINEAYNILSNDIDKTDNKQFSSFDNPFSQMSGNVYAMNIDPSTMMNMLFGSNGIPNLNGCQSTASSPLLSQLFDFPQFAPQNSAQFPKKQDNLYPGFSQYSYESKPTTINKTLEISLLESFTGCKVSIDINRWIIESDLKIEETENIYITIPRGIDNNEIITLENKGNVISNKNKGDVKIKIIINNNTDFERNGIDLIYKKTISLKDSLCGFSFDMKYIDNREFKINNESGNIIPANFKKIIPAMGMQRDNDIGNLIIIFDIDYPKTLTKEQVNSLNQIL